MKSFSFGKRQMANGKRNGKWQMANGKWQTKRQMANGKKKKKIANSEIGKLDWQTGPLIFQMKMMGICWKYNSGLNEWSLGHQIFFQKKVWKFSFSKICIFSGIAKNFRLRRPL